MACPTEVKQGCLLVSVKQVLNPSRQKSFQVEYLNYPSNYPSPPPPAPETAVWFNPPLFLHLTVLFVQSLVSALVFCRVRECGERARAGKTLIGEYSSLMCCWWVASGKLLLGDVSLLPNALLRLDFLLVLNLFPVGWCFCVGLALWSTVTPGQNSSGLFSNPREARLADCKPFSNLFALAILNLKGLLFCS